MKVDWQRRFDHAFEAWGRRPPRTPAEEAAARVVAALPRRRSVWVGTPFRVAAAAASLLLVIAAAWIALQPVPPEASEVDVPPLDEGVVLLWLDDQTPLYLTVAPPATKGGS